jgi:hypothetical protein
MLRVAPTDLTFASFWYISRVSCQLEYTDTRPPLAPRLLETLTNLPSSFLMLCRYSSMSGGRGLCTRNSAGERVPKGWVYGRRLVFVSERTNKRHHHHQKKICSGIFWKSAFLRLCLHASGMRHSTWNGNSEHRLSSCEETLSTPFKVDQSMKIRSWMGDAGLCCGLSGCKPHPHERSDMSTSSTLRSIILIFFTLSFRASPSESRLRASETQSDCAIGLQLYGALLNLIGGRSIVLSGMLSSFENGASDTTCVSTATPAPLIGGRGGRGGGGHITPSKRSSIREHRATPS